MSAYDPFEDLTGDRTARTWIDTDGDDAYQRKVRERRRPGGLYGGMLIDDLSRLLPYELGSGEAFAARLEAADDELGQRVLDALPGFYGPPRNLQDALRAFSEACVQELASGSVNLEIELFTDPHGNRSPQFLVHLLPNTTLWGPRRRPRQWVSGAGHSAKTRRGVQYVDLDPSRLVRFDLPRPMRRALRKSLRALEKVDRLQSSAIDMATSNPVPGFEVDAQRRMVAAYARSATRETGWDGRALCTEDMLETYRIWRALRFARFQVALRDVILSGLQTALDRAGELLDFSAHLVVEDILTARMLDEAEEDFQQGRRSFRELLDLTYKPLPVGSGGKAAAPRAEPRTGGSPATPAPAPVETTAPE